MSVKGAEGSENEGQDSEKSAPHAYTSTIKAGLGLPDIAKDGGCRRGQCDVEGR